MTTQTIARRAASVAAWLAAAVTSASAWAAPATEGDIRDIRGPVAIPAWWRWPLVGLLACAAVAVAVVLFRRWRAHARRPLSPLEHSRRALTAAEALARAGKARAWAEVIAETVRAALAARLGAVVLPQTTRELATATWTSPPLSVELRAEQILGLLDTCDLARFARANYDPTELLESTAVAREVVERLFAPPPKTPAVAPVLTQTVTP